MYQKRLFMKIIRLVLLSILIGIYFCSCDKDDTDSLKGTKWIYSVTYGNVYTEETIEFKSSTYRFSTNRKTENENGSIDIETSVSTGNYTHEGRAVYLESGTLMGHGTHLVMSESGDALCAITVIAIKEYKKQR